MIAVYSGLYLGHFLPHNERKRYFPACNDVLFANRGQFRLMRQNVFGGFSGKELQ